MPNWKKVIVSGSNAVLNQITASGAIVSTDANSNLSGSFSGSFQGDGTNLNLASNTTIPTQNPFPLTASSAAIISRSFASGDTDSTALRLLGSGSVSQSGIFEVEGSAGPLFSVADGLDGVLMEVNNISGLPLFQVSSSNEVFINRGNLTSGVTTATASFAMFSGSFQGNASQLTNISPSSITSGTFVTNSQTGSFVTNSQTGSFVTNSQTGSMTVATASYVENAQTASYVETAQTASYVGVGTTSGLVPFTTAGGKLTTEAEFKYNTTTNQLTVDSLNVQHLTSSFITASRIHTSGSNIFGDDTTDTQTLIGTTKITGSAQITGSLTGTPGTTNNLTASYAITASHALLAESVSVSPTLQEVTTQGSFTTIPITASILSATASNAYNVNADSLTVKGGDGIFAGGSNGGNLNLQGGDSSGASGARRGGNVIIRGGEGPTSSGSISITGDTSITGSFIIEKSGSTVFEVIGSEGTLFSIDDDLDGVIFTANDRSGLPVLEASASGEVYIGKAPQSLYTTAVISSTTANISQSIFGLSTSSYGGVFVDYTANSGSNARAGSIVSVWNGSSINFTETTTLDVGNTSNLLMQVAISQSQAQVQSYATTAGYNIKTIIRSI